MKIKYKDIVGHLIIEKYSNSCKHCCFNQDLFCVPYKIWQCDRTIFEESKSQVFEI